MARHLEGLSFNMGHLTAAYAPACSFKQYMDEVFAQKLVLLTGLIRQSAASGAVTDLHELMYWYTLDAFGQIGFGVEVGCLTSGGKVPFATAFDESQKVGGCSACAPHSDCQPDGSVVAAL